MPFRATPEPRGSSVEFAEYRYVGDDLRRLDWRVYGADHFVKEFERIPTSGWCS